MNHIPTPRKRFYVRLVASYLLVPLVPPLVFLLMTTGPPAPDWAGTLLIFFPFGFAGMLLFGTPLLFCYLRLGLTGFIPFAAGGGLCAAITAYIVIHNSHDLSTLPLYTVTGMIAGYIFRVFLFGIAR